FGERRGDAQRRAEGHDRQDSPRPAQAEPPAPFPARLAERLPGASEGTTAYGRLHETVGEVRKHDRYAHAQREQGKPAEGYVDLGTGDHEDGPVPEVDAVGADADPAHRSRSQEARD